MVLTREYEVVAAVPGTPRVTRYPGLYEAADALAAISAAIKSYPRFLSEIRKAVPSAIVSARRV